MPVYAVVGATDPGPIQHPAITLVNPNGSSFNPSYHSLRTGTWVSASCTVTAGTYNNGVLYCTPLVFATQRTIDKLAIEVTVVAAAGGLYRIGIYGDDGTGKPGTLLIDAGTVDVTATGALETSLFTLTLTPGMYWFASVQQGAPATTATVRQNGSSVFGVVGINAIDATQGNLAGYNMGTGVTGALPTTAPISPSASSRVPRVAVRLSA